MLGLHLCGERPADLLQFGDVPCGVEGLYVVGRIWPSPCCASHSVVQLGVVTDVREQLRVARPAGADEIADLAVDGGAVPALAETAA